MKANQPKQFLPVLGREVFLRSLDCFTNIDADKPPEHPRIISQIVIVLAESFRSQYRSEVMDDERITWANPGAERQDSVFNGLSVVDDSASIVAIHDAARPLVTEDEILRVFADGFEHGAAVLGVPMKATVKESDDGKFVSRTVPRSHLWEIHTPQVATKELFMLGFENAKAKGLEVTDDVSVVEALGKPVRLTRGEYTNIKLTTPDDIQVAEEILKSRGIDAPKTNNESIRGEERKQ
jgi:2-C-methyl-D-erythritol 4-phosphate cytidylyltransferase